MIVDTVVLVHTLLARTPEADLCATALRRAESISAPELVLSEALSAVWQWARAGRISRATARSILADVPEVLQTIIPVRELWIDALDLAIERDHTPYDTLFVALAAREDDRVITLDRRMLAKFPEWTVRPGDV